jgi:hypothetical protein
MARTLRILPVGFATSPRVRIGTRLSTASGAFIHSFAALARPLQRLRGIPHPQRPPKAKALTHLERACASSREAKARAVFF